MKSILIANNVYIALRIPNIPKWKVCWWWYVNIYLTDYHLDFNLNHILAMAVGVVLSTLKEFVYVNKMIQNPNALLG
jgi:hypothetical protein